LNLAALIAGLASAAALVGSLVFLARQTRESVHQSLVANELAGVRAKAQNFEAVDRVIAYFIEYPELRQYLYENVELPEDPTRRARVFTVAELMADALQSCYWLYQQHGLDVLRAVDATADIRDDLDDYAEFILAMSPAVRSLVRAHSRQWPHLAKKLDTIESTMTDLDGEHGYLS
jgi:hypothetical protein